MNLRNFDEDWDERMREWESVHKPAIRLLGCLSVLIRLCIICVCGCVGGLIGLYVWSLFQ